MITASNETCAGAVAPTAAPTARVLVIEDNAVNQLLVGRQLAKLGHQYEIAAEAEAGLDLLARDDHGFDVVLMDWQLPGIDGLEATRRIRESEEGSARHVPVVALTASALSSDRHACREAGMDDFLAKPASLAALGDVITRWVGGRILTSRGTSPSRGSPRDLRPPRSSRCSPGTTT